jgi:hypothetical protein
VYAAFRVDLIPRFVGTMPGCQVKFNIVSGIGERKPFYSDIARRRLVNLVKGMEDELSTSFIAIDMNKPI